MKIVARHGETSFEACVSKAETKENATSFQGHEQLASGFDQAVEGTGRRAIASRGGHRYLALPEGAGL
jgi:hypothetical protein